MQNTELRLVKATDMGQMDIGDFEKELDPARPALVVIAMGTTFKGAMDDQLIDSFVLDITTWKKLSHKIGCSNSRARLFNLSEFELCR